MKKNFLSLEESPSKVIKREKQFSQAKSTSPNLIKHQILDAEEEGQSILQKAKADASEIVTQAQNKAEKIRTEAYEAGRKEAENETLENLLNVKEERLKVWSTVEKDVLRLAVKVAEKIIGSEVSKNKKVRGEIVYNALHAARQKETLTVRVNSGDLPIVEELRNSLSKINPEQVIDFVADQAVSSGGCIIESSVGKIDARLETQLRILENALLSQVSG